MAASAIRSDSPRIAIGETATLSDHFSDYGVPVWDRDWRELIYLRDYFPFFDPRYKVTWQQSGSPLFSEGDRLETLIQRHLPKTEAHLFDPKFGHFIEEKRGWCLQAIYCGNSLNPKECERAHKYAREHRFATRDLGLPIEGGNTFLLQNDTEEWHLFIGRVSGLLCQFELERRGFFTRDAVDTEMKVMGAVKERFRETAKASGEDAAELQAKWRLTKREIGRILDAKVTVLPQISYHLDLDILPFPSDRAIGVHDPEMASVILSGLVPAPGAPLDRECLEEYRANNAVRREVTQPLVEKMIARMKKRGFRVIRMAGMFEDRRIPDARTVPQPLNLFNSVVIDHTLHMLGPCVERTWVLMMQFALTLQKALPDLEIAVTYGKGRDSPHSELLRKCDAGLHCLTTEFVKSDS